MVLKRRRKGGEILGLGTPNFKLTLKLWLKRFFTEIVDIYISIVSDEGGVPPSSATKEVYLPRQITSNRLTNHSKRGDLH